MGIFKKKTVVKKPISAPAPDEDETQAEEDYVEELSDPGKVKTAPAPVPTEKPKPTIQEVPVCMSQTQINNLIIDNSMMLKYIISRIDEDD